MATATQKRLRNKWLKALETGILNGKKYKKGYGMLMDEHGGFCCLGVAEIIAKSDVDMEEAGLSEETRDLFGFQSNAGCEQPTPNYEDMANMNDGHNDGYTTKRTGARSHKQIAAFVRKHPEKVWVN